MLVCIIKGGSLPPKILLICFYQLYSWRTQITAHRKRNRYCISFLCCITNHYKLVYVKPHTFIMSVFVSQISGHSLAGFSFSGFHQILARAADSSEAWLGKDPLQTSSGCWQHSSPYSFRVQFSTILLAVGWKSLLPPRCCLLFLAMWPSL